MNNSFILFIFTKFKFHFFKLLNYNLGHLLSIYIYLLKYIIGQTPNVKYHIYIWMSFTFRLNISLR